MGVSSSDCDETFFPVYYNHIDIQGTAVTFEAATERAIRGEGKIVRYQGTPTRSRYYNKRVGELTTLGNMYGDGPGVQRSHVSNVPKSVLRSQTRFSGFEIDDAHGNRDWQGILNSHTNGVQNSRSVSRPFVGLPFEHLNSSVSVLVPNEVRSKERVKNMGLADTPEVKDRSEYLVDHQAFLEAKRAEYVRRVQAEMRGEVHNSQRPYSEDFVAVLPNTYTDPRRNVPLDFQRRSREIVKPQIVGTKDELAWLTPPVFPPPVGYTGYWDVCAGHESILQVMALSGANPDNSPSLTAHFMYPDLLSAIQRLQYGTYLIHFQKNETPHERYFYVKSLPLANRGQFCPFLCWSVHRHSQTALDAIPMCNVMWVTQGIDSSENFKKYYIGGDYINGPFVGKHRSECLVHGAITVWVYDGKQLRGIDVLATDPLVFALWMKLLEDFSQLNAVLDPTGNVRALQKDIENSKVEGRLAEYYSKKRDKSFFR